MQHLYNEGYLMRIRLNFDPVAGIGWLNLLGCSWSRLFEMLFQKYFLQSLLNKTTMLQAGVQNLFDINALYLEYRLP